MSQDSDEARLGVIQRFLLATDHAPDRLDGQYDGTLNPALRPRPDKRYPTLTPLPLPEAAKLAPSSVPALAAIADAGERGPAPGGGPVDIDALARIAYFTNGITKSVRRSGQEMAFRAAPTTGALYHIEIYLVTGDLPGLPAGVYHYGAHDHAFRALRAGDFRQVIVEATGHEPSIAQAPAILVMTSVFWRNAWKYAARAYRHTYWDAGTILPNTLAVAAAADVPARLVLSFADPVIATLLGLDLDREGMVALVALGADGPPPAAPLVSPLDLPVEPYSIREVDFPLISETHRATLLNSGEDAARWRQQRAHSPVATATRALIALPVPDPSDLQDVPIETIIRRRGSTRRFAREPITLLQLSILLDTSTRGVTSDALGPEGIPFNDLYLFINSVEGLRSGTYLYYRSEHSLEPLQLMREMEAREQTHFLALEQDLGGDAAVNIYLLADLDPILSAFGDRGYRLAQLGGALVAGKLYLAAYALGLGATGLTFFDQAVIDAFSPPVAGDRVMFLIAVGQPARRSDE